MQSTEQEQLDPEGLDRGARALQGLEVLVIELLRAHRSDQIRTMHRGVLKRKESVDQSRLQVVVAGDRDQFIGAQLLSWRKILQAAGVADLVVEFAAEIRIFA